MDLFDALIKLSQSTKTDYREIEARLRSVIGMGGIDIYYITSHYNPEEEVKPVLLDGAAVVDSRYFIGFTLRKAKGNQVEIVVNRLTDICSVDYTFTKDNVEVYFNFSNGFNQYTIVDDSASEGKLIKFANDVRNLAKFS